MMVLRKEVATEEVLTVSRFCKKHGMQGMHASKKATENIFAKRSSDIFTKNLGG